MTRLILILVCSSLGLASALGGIAPDADRTYLHTAEDSQTKNLTLAPSVYTFRADAEPNGYHWVEWYNTYSGGTPVATAHLYYYDDTDFNISGNGWVRAEVYGSDIVGGWGGWQASYRWNITVDTVAPTTPGTPDLSSSDDTGYSSADNITRLTSGLTFSWSASSDSGTGVAGYEWKLNSGSWSSLTTSRSADVSASAGSHTFYVRAKDAANNYSGSSSLTFSVDTTAPSVPTLVSPANGSSMGDQTPTFDWNNSTDGSSGVYRYNIEVYDWDLSWGDISVWTTSSAYTPGANIPYDTVYWKVRAEDRAGNISGYSSEWSVNIVDTTAPTIPSAPDLNSSDDSGYSSSDNITRYTSGLTFYWNASTDNGTGMAGYEWKLDSGSWSYIGNTTSKDISASEGSHTLYIRAKDNAGNLSGASSLTFTVDAAAPSIPTLASPANGSSTGDQTPTFDWNNSTDASSGLYQYEVEIYDWDLSWDDISTTTTASTFTPGANIPFDTIYWKIRAVDRAGNISAYSPEWHFDLVNNPPSQPGTITISGVSSNSATMAWGASTDSDGDSVTYEVEYGINNTLGWSSAGTTTGTSKILTGLIPATSYVARVRSIDGKGGTSSWRELDPAFTTRAVKEIVSAYWLPPLTVPEGSLVTMRAEVYGYTTGTSFNFTIYEDDGLLSDETVTTLTGAAYASNGTYYVDVSWVSKWQNDQIGDPEFYFEVVNGSVAKESGRSASEKLVITTRRVWHAWEHTKNQTAITADPTVAVTWSADERPAGAKLAQVAFTWDMNLGAYADNELELTCYGPNWQKTRMVKLAVNGG